MRVNRRVTLVVGSGGKALVRGKLRDATSKLGIVGARKVGIARIEAAHVTLGGRAGRYVEVVLVCRRVGRGHDDRLGCELRNLPRHLIIRVNGGADLLLPAATDGRDDKRGMGNDESCLECHGVPPCA